MSPVADAELYLSALEGHIALARLHADSVSEAIEQSPDCTEMADYRAHLLVDQLSDVQIAVRELLNEVRK
jgi:type IV secretory pathway ATPase VirB11/archaellum biosynthesis ATPase